jgi:hypothetical protein
MFLFKKKKLILECFTRIPRIAEIGIPRASAFIPEWWKAVPKALNLPNPQGMVMPTHTMKTCAGFIDLYQQGNIQPLWSELIIEVNEKSYTWQFADNFSPPIIEHPKNQYATEHFNFNNWRHAKFESPWLVKCNKDVKFLGFEPSYNHLLNDYGLKMLPGVVDFKYQHGLNVNVFIPAIIRRIKLDYCYPMYQWICLDSDYDVEWKPIVVDEIEYRKVEYSSNHRPYFIGTFKKARKCPFSGGK